MTQPTLVASSNVANASFANGAALTSASFTWLTGDVLLAEGITEDNGATMSLPTASGLTFTQLAATNTASECKVYLWEAVAASGGSGTVGSTNTSGSSKVMGMHVRQYRGSSGRGTPVTGTNDAGRTWNLTRADTDSHVQIAIGDFTANADVTVDPDPSTDGTISYAQTSAGYTGIGVHWSNQGATGTTAYGYANQTGSVSNSYILVEVKGTTGSPTIDTQPVQQTAAVGGTATFTVSATASAGSLTYQWKELSSGSLGNVSTGTGGTTASYTTATLSSADKGRYFVCDVTDSNGTTRTAGAFLFISGLGSSAKGFGLDSTWPQNRKHGGDRATSTLLRTFIGITPDNDQASAAVWADFYFGASGPATHNVSLAEALTAADSVSAVMTAGVALSEAGSAADVLVGVATILAALSESGTATDTLTQGAAYAVSVAETGTAADAISMLLTAAAAITEAVSAADALTVALSAVVALSEAGSATDSPSATRTSPVSLSETGTATDVVSAGAATHSVSIAETGAAADVLTAIATLAAALSEAGTATDTVSTAGAIYSLTLAETGTASDVVSAIATRVASLAEAGAAADQVTAIATLQAALAEAQAAADLLTALGTVTVAIVETANAQDIIALLTDEVGGGGRTITVKAGTRTIIVSLHGRTVNVSAPSRTIH